MDTNSHFAYVQARVQARHGRRLAPSEWQTLEAARDIASFLQGVRSTHLRRWTEHLPADVDPHRIEQSLRNDWKEYVAEIASWVNADWRPSVEWLATLVDLQVVAHLVRGFPVAYWMREDPVFSEYAFDDAARRKEALASSEIGVAMMALGPEQNPLAVWLNHWRTLQPKVGPGLRSRLDEFANIVIRNLAVDRESASLPRQGPRPVLIRDLEHHFRRCSGTIGAVFAHIGLMGLCWERLRAGLLMRILVPAAQGRPQWA